MKGNTTSHVFTVKLPFSLLRQIGQESDESRVSKGTIVRQALETWFANTSNLWLHRIETATGSILANKTKRKKSDWSVIYKLTRVPSTLLPEEEVLKSRQRGLS